MERHLDDELKNYKLKLLKMTTLVEEAIHQSIEALRTRNRYLAESVIKRDNEIDEMENEIEEQAIELLALFQPMAGDLRFITTGMHVNTYLERIGDLTDNICHGVIALADQPLPKSLSDISKLSDQAKFMVTKALDAFVNRDEALAKEVILADRTANELRDQIMNEIVENLAMSPASARQWVWTLFIVRDMERICDCAAAIAEDVVYMVSAEMVKHHREKL